jgi:hypothetical protein
MGKLLMISMLIATIAIPLRHLSASDATRGLRRAVIEFCWFNLFYTFALAYLVPRLL